MSVTKFTAGLEEPLIAVETRARDAESRNFEVAVVNLTNLSEALKQTFDGIFGRNFMQSYKVTIDYPRQVIYFEKHESVAGGG